MAEQLTAHACRFAHVAYFYHSLPISFHIAVALYIVTHSLLFSPTLSVASFLELCVLFHCLTFLLSIELFYPTQAYFESIQREKSFNLFVCFEKLQTLFLVWKLLK